MYVFYTHLEPRDAQRIQNGEERYFDEGDVESEEAGDVPRWVDLLV